LLHTRIQWMEDVLSLRPGAYHTFTLLGKIMLRKPLYRYALADFHPGGWQEARDFRPIEAAPPETARLSLDAVRLLEALASWGRAEHVQVMYSLPWCYASPRMIAPYQRQQAAFLAAVARHIKILKDPTLGLHPVREHFADTAVHLARDGVRLRTDLLAAELIHQEFWKAEELDALCKGRESGPVQPAPRSF